MARLVLELEAQANRVVRLEMKRQGFPATATNKPIAIRQRKEPTWESEMITGSLGGTYWNVTKSPPQTPAAAAIWNASWAARYHAVVALLTETAWKPARPTRDENNRNVADPRLFAAFHDPEYRFNEGSPDWPYKYDVGELWHHFLPDSVMVGNTRVAVRGKGVPTFNNLQSRWTIFRRYQLEKYGIEDPTGAITFESMGMRDPNDPTPPPFVSADVAPTPAPADAVYAENPVDPAKQEFTMDGIGTEEFAALITAISQRFSGNERLVTPGNTSLTPPDGSTPIEPVVAEPSQTEQGDGSVMDYLSENAAPLAAAAAITGAAIGIFAILKR